jgi:hypothetical protein
LREVKVSVCGQKNLYTELAGDLTQNPVNERPVPYPETTRPNLETK